MPPEVCTTNKLEALRNEITSGATHFNIGYSPTHITYRLAGSMPVDTVNILLSKRDKAISKLVIPQMATAPQWQIDQYHQRFKYLNQKFQIRIDDYLHNGSNGPYHLANPAIAKLVLDSWKFLHDKTAAFVFAVCVMSNHVHVIVGNEQPAQLIDISKLIRRTKSFTGGKANKILGLTGTPFWHDQYHDATIRRGRFLRAMWYVLNNPVKAGLVGNWREWPHTYVHPDYIRLFV